MAYQHFVDDLTQKLHKNTNEIPLSLTFDDVLLVPNHSNVTSRKDCDTKTYISKKIPLAIPIVSSNMDTVTEANMAISMAREGGIGFIHRFLSVSEQVKQVNKVKRSESILIENPYTLSENSRLKDVWQLLKEKSVSSILIVDPDKKHHLDVGSDVVPADEAVCSAAVDLDRLDRDVHQFELVKKGPDQGSGEGDLRFVGANPGLDQGLALLHFNQS